MKHSAHSNNFRWRSVMGWGSISDDDMQLMAEELRSRVEKEGDPFNGDDWTVYQVAGYMLHLLSEKRRREDNGMV